MKDLLSVKCLECHKVEVNVITICVGDFTRYQRNMSLSLLSLNELQSYLLNYGRMLPWCTSLTKYVFKLSLGGEA